MVTHVCPLWGASLRLLELGEGSRVAGQGQGFMVWGLGFRIGPRRIRTHTCAAQSTLSAQPHLVNMSS
jgi:hypothetical protein